VANRSKHKSAVVKLNGPGSALSTRLTRQPCAASSSTVVPTSASISKACRWQQCADVASQLSVSTNPAHKYALDAGVRLATSSEAANGNSRSAANSPPTTRFDESVARLSAAMALSSAQTIIVVVERESFLREKGKKKGKKKCHFQKLEVESGESLQHQLAVTQRELQLCKQTTPDCC
jgi:hypothetical protein